MQSQIWSKSEYQDKKVWLKMSYFQLFNKTFPPLVSKWPGTGAIRGAKWKSYSFFLLRRVKVCYETGRFLTVCLLFERFHSQNSNFQGAKYPEKFIFEAWTPPPPPLPWYSALVFVGNQTNATVCSFIPRTNYTQSIKKGFVWPFPNLLKP